MFHNARWANGGVPGGFSPDGSIQNGPRRLRPIKGLQWQTLVRGDIGRQRLFWPVANLPAPVQLRYSIETRSPHRQLLSPRKFEMTIPGVAGAVASAPLPSNGFPHGCSLKKDSYPYCR